LLVALTCSDCCDPRRSRSPPGTETSRAEARHQKERIDRLSKSDSTDPASHDSLTGREDSSSDLLPAVYEPPRDPDPERAQPQQQSDLENSPEPREGTLDWLVLQPTVVLDGVELPAIHKIPDGASFAEPDGSYCRVIRPDGERCRARPTRRFGVCLAHAGGGG